MHYNRTVSEQDADRPFVVLHNQRNLPIHKPRLERRRRLALALPPSNVLTRRMIASRSPRPPLSCSGGEFANLQASGLAVLEEKLELEKENNAMPMRQIDEDRAENHEESLNVEALFTPTMANLEFDFFH
jgi:hypothetical protein